MRNYNYVMCHYKKKNPLPIKLTQFFIITSIVRCFPISEILKSKGEKVHLRINELYLSIS